MSEIQINPVSSEEKEKESIFDRFSRERNEWSIIVKEIASRFKGNVEELHEVQVDLYSKRQEALEYKNQLTVTFSKLKKKYNEEWSKVYNDLTFDSDYRYNEKEKAREADTKVGELKLRLEALQSHVEFFKDTMGTIDNMIFGVKHRIEIEDYRRGIK
jgi:hypothetical protein